MHRMFDIDGKSENCVEESSDEIKLEIGLSKYENANEPQEDDIGTRRKSFSLKS